MEMPDRIAILEKEVKELTKIVNGLEKKTTEIVAKEELNTYKFDQIMERIDGINNKMDDFAKVPKNRWELVVTTIITGLVGGIVAMLVFNK